MNDLRQFMKILYPLASWSFRLDTSYGSKQISPMTRRMLLETPHYQPLPGRIPERLAGDEQR
jgi:hypothetical protein